MLYHTPREPFKAFVNSSYLLISKGAPVNVVRIDGTLNGAKALIEYKDNDHYVDVEDLAFDKTPNGYGHILYELEGKYRDANKGIH